MRKKNYKGRCEKVSVSKSEDVCRLYSEIQKKYLDMLEENQEIKEIQCNVLLDGLEIGEYTSDFVCKKTGNHLMVRECVEENKWNQGIKYSTSNKKIATVKKGKIVASKKGTATISVKYKNKTCRFKVTVKNASLNLSEKSLSLKKGKTYTFKVCFILVHCC